VPPRPAARAPAAAGRGVVGTGSAGGPPRAVAGAAVAPAVGGAAPTPAAAAAAAAAASAAAADDPRACWAGVIRRAPAAPVALSTQWRTSARAVIRRAPKKEQIKKKGLERPLVRHELSQAVLPPSRRGRRDSRLHAGDASGAFQKNWPFLYRHRPSREAVGARPRGDPAPPSGTVAAAIAIEAPAGRIGGG